MPATDKPPPPNPQPPGENHEGTVVSGEAKVGGELQACCRQGGVDPANSYQWLRDGAEINASDDNYTRKPGHKISVKASFDKRRSHAENHQR